MKKVIAHLKGGLGNQMFIYAAARSLSLDADADLCFRVDKLINDGFGRKFSLSDFHCAGTILPYRRVPWRKMCTFVREQMKKCGIFKFGRVLVLPGGTAHIYRKLPEKWFGSISLEGYFQTERYFYQHRFVIADDFKLADDSWLLRDPMANRIKHEANPIFLHVRSYKDIKGHLDGSASLPVAYYEAAMRILKVKLGGGVIFLFSDDLPWAYERLYGTALQVGFQLVPVEPVAGLLPNDRHSSSYLRDFELMRQCRHGVVADSSFSWWSGWLCEQYHGETNCIMLRPRKSDIGDMQDFWPKRWIPVEYAL